MKNDSSNSGDEQALPQNVGSAPSRTVRRWCDMPIAECPHCGHQWQTDDYYDLAAGSELTCPKCEQTCHVESVDTIMQVCLTNSKT